MNLKNILLGTSASALFVTGAVAADLPVAPEPVDYVRVCDVHGTGFFYIPGTETCLQVGGDVRSRYTYNDINAGSRAGSPSEFSARGRIWLDARNESEWGSIRTYIRYTASTDTNGAGGGSADLDRAFIQVGNFVTGYASSFMNLTYGAYAINNVYGTFDSDNTTWLAGYTFDLGNGAYLAASIEAPESAGINSVNSGTGAVADISGGVTWPDAGFNLGIDQGWGSAGIVAGVHQVRPATIGIDSEVGWFVGGGAEFNVLSSTKIGGTAFYGDGASQRLGLSFAGNDIVDAVSVDGGSLDLVRAWTASLGLTHDFNSEITFSINGSYFDAEVDTAVADIGVDGWMVGASAEYTPLAGLTFGAGVEYINAEADLSAGGASISDSEDAYAITLQVVRSF